MTIDYSAYDEFWMLRGTADNDRFHCDPDCDAIIHPERLEARERDVVAFYDALPCPRCHGETMSASEELVYVSSAAGRRGNTRYHTDRRCGHCQKIDQVVMKSLSAIESHYQPCAECADPDGATDTSGEMERTPCPLCGEKVKLLSSHLPCEDGQEVRADGGERA